MANSSLEYALITVDKDFNLKKLTYNIVVYSEIIINFDGGLDWLDESLNDITLGDRIVLIKYEVKEPTIFLTEKYDEVKCNDMYHFFVSSNVKNIVATDFRKTNEILSRLVSKDKLARIYSRETRIYVLDEVIGRKGWESFEDLFYVLNSNVNWVVLRNYEFLPNNFWGNDDDVDILCDDLRKTVSISYARKRSPGVSGYEVKVSGKWVPFDIRYLGDNYYPDVWVLDILRRVQTYNNCVPIMDKVNMFYSLIYHVLTHKKSIKDKYVNELNELSLSLSGKKIFERGSINFSSLALPLLKKYMAYKNYYYFYPYDRSVPITDSSKQLTMSKTCKSIREPIAKFYGHKLKVVVYGLSPNFVKEIYKSKRKIWKSI